MKIVFPPEYESEDLSAATTFAVFTCIPNPLDKDFNEELESIAPDENGFTSRLIGGMRANSGERSVVDSFSVWLPAPSNIAWNDGMTPGDFSKSALFEGAKQLIGKLFNREGDAEVGMSAGDIAKSSAVLLKGKLGGFGEKAFYEARIIQNPNTRTTFQGHPVRQFSFNFKFIPRTEKEAKQVRALVKAFSRNIYASTSGQLGSAAFALNYPPTWKIRFIRGDSENPYVPKIYESFLTAVTSTLNSEGAFWHEDGAPKSIDLTLTFQETRTLDRNLYDKMESAAESTPVPDPEDGIVDRDWVTRLEKNSAISNIRGRVSDLRSRITTPSTLASRIRRR
jgi:hypothetical protein